MQQHLPSTVLKRQIIYSFSTSNSSLVATAPTVYGIETKLDYRIDNKSEYELQQHLPSTVLKPIMVQLPLRIEFGLVATAPTVYGIET